MNKIGGVIGMTKIFIDPGHGGADSGATGNGLREKDLTLKISLKLRDILSNEYEGHSLRLSRTTDTSVSLSERTNMANSWGAHYLVSVHINAGGGTGFESYIYNGSYSGKPETNRLRGVVHDEVINETAFRDRGKKEANFHMLRESNMPAILTENGFIDHQEDAGRLKNDAFLTQLARGHAIGLAKAFGLQKKSGKMTHYRVVTGSFTSRKNAEKRVNELKNKGFTSFIDIFKRDGTTYYRVITGSYKNRTNAQKQVDALKKAGFKAFIDIYEA